MVRYYVRVSTNEQKTDRQLLACPKADLIYIDKMSGATKERPELKRLLNDLQADDIVIVKSIDRLSRSTRDLFDIIEEIEKKNAVLKILDMNLETSTPMGKFFLTVLAALAQLERETIRERTLEGVAIAKAAGKYRGRKKGAIALKGDALKRFLYFYKLGMSKSKLAEEFGVPRATVYRWIRVLRERELI